MFPSGRFGNVKIIFIFPLFWGNCRSGTERSIRVQKESPLCGECE